MHKQKPIYLFAVIFSLFIAFSSLLFILSTRVNLGFYMIVPIIFFVIIVVFMIMATSLSSGAFERNQAMSTICPKCKKSNKIDAKYCSYCGTSLYSVVVCDFCGEENPNGSTRCSKCNANLEWYKWIKESLPY